MEGSGISSTLKPVLAMVWRKPSSHCSSGSVVLASGSMLMRWFSSRLSAVSQEVRSEA